MSPSQPFGLLLEELRRAGHPIGVWDALMVRRLADRYSGASREEIRDALAALLGKDVEGQERVRQAFERAFPAPLIPVMRDVVTFSSPVAAAQSREAPRVKRGRPLAWGLPVGFASVGLWLVLAQPF
ncbi:MAG TPA: hypothetical protein VFB81_17595, partial [Myxococcales bacterium]|nr:hypothetical protein [Myxococcales bacterium]